MKLFAFNTVRAPYRVDLYNLLGDKACLTVFFEQEHDPARNRDWYSNDFRGFEMKHAKNWHRSLKYPKWDVLRWVKEKGTDLVYMSEWSSVTALLLIAKCIICRIPYVISMDGYLERPGRRGNPVKRFVKKVIAHYAMAAIGTGTATARYARSIGFTEDSVFTVGFTTVKDAELIRQPPSTKEKATLKKLMSLDPDVHYVLSVGQLVDRKGHDLLIQAWTQIPNRENWKLLIIGDGNKKDELQDHIRAEGISDVIILPGVDKRTLFRYYWCADIFALSTREDIWGLVINEAMAAALPVLTTEQCVAGVELVDHGVNGYLYNCEDTAHCAEYLYQLMGDEHLREWMGKNNLSKMKDFTVEREADKIYEVLSNLIARKNN